MEAPVLIGRDSGARLEGQMILPPDAELALDDRHVVSCEGGVGVAADDRSLPGDVAAAARALEQDLVSPPVGMHQRRARTQRLLHGDDDRQRRGLDADRPEGGLGELRRVRRCRGEGLAVVAYPVGGEQRMVRDANAVHPGRVLCCDHRPHPGHRLGRRDVERHDAGRGDLRPQHRGVQHTRRGTIDRVARAAGELVAGVAAGIVHHGGAGVHAILLNCAGLPRAPARRR